MGSFSDDEQDAQLDRLDEEDDIVEAPSPEPKPWPPVRTAAPKASPTTIAIPDVSTDSSDEVTNQLFKDLMDCRKEVHSDQIYGSHRCLTSFQISRKHNILEEDIFDEAFLFSLSLTPPQGLYHDWLPAYHAYQWLRVDGASFRHMLQDHTRHGKSVDEKCEKYGKQFLQFCIRHKWVPGERYVFI